MKITRLLFAFGILAFLAGCGNDDGNETEIFNTTLEAAMNTHADIVLQNYIDSRNDAQDILEAVQAFVDNPTEATHNAAKQAWLDAQETYGQTEVFRFYGGPIDDEDGPEGQLNAWPLDESLIDYVNGAVNGDDPADNVGVNIVNSPDAYPSITKAVIAGLNELDGGETVFLGPPSIYIFLKHFVRQKVYVVLGNCETSDSDN